MSRHRAGASEDAAGEGHPLSDKRRKYFKPREVADYLDLNRRTVYDLIHRGAIRGHKFGGSIRVSRAEILRFEEEGEMGRAVECLIDQTLLQG